MCLRSLGGRNALTSAPSRPLAHRHGLLYVTRGRRLMSQFRDIDNIATSDSSTAVTRKAAAAPKRRGMQAKQAEEADADEASDAGEFQSTVDAAARKRKPRKPTAERHAHAREEAHRVMSDRVDSIGITPPWAISGATAEDAAQQQLALAKYMASRGADTAERRKRKKKVATPKVTVMQVTSELEAKVITRDANGYARVDRTALGEGLMQTYALSVYEGKEKKFMDYMKPKLLDVSPAVYDKLEGKLVPRVVEFNLPTKYIKTFSERNLKWSNKAVKYKGGGWVFVKAILDDELLDTLNKMIYFQNFRTTIKYKFKFEDEESVLPVPCSQEEIAEIEAWKLHVDEEEEELEKCKEYGGEVDLEIANKVIRRDEMQEDLDIDEQGNTIYRKDFTGTYLNPNNFYMSATPQPLAGDPIWGQPCNFGNLSYEGPPGASVASYETGAKRASERGASRQGLKKRVSPVDSNNRDGSTTASLGENPRNMDSAAYSSHRRPGTSASHGQAGQHTPLTVPPYVAPAKSFGARPGTPSRQDRSAPARSTESGWYEPPASASFD